MKLPKYLARAGMSQAEFARQCGLSEATISALCSNDAWITKKTAQKIVAATNGRVTPNDFLEMA